MAAASRPRTLGSMTVETETEYLVTLDVGRRAPDELSVAVQDHVVTVEGVGLDEAVRLPLDADVEWLRVNFEPGLLVLHAPKLPPPEHDRRMVEIVRSH
jgi:HSP20 family molecular chaperone IbpA